MSLYEHALRPLLFRLDAEAAHHLALGALSLLEEAVPVAKLLRSSANPSRLPVTVAGLNFPNGVGLAAGLDKNAEAIAGLFSTGFGFLEVGTVTPRAQPGNPAPRLFRLREQEALINRMGFNNHGIAAMAENLAQARWRPGPVGVNVGKNKDTPLEAAADDYVECLEQLGPLADYAVVNLSSPNTPGLRSLQEPEALEQLLRRARAATLKPLFLKIAPDLADEAIDSAVDVAVGAGLDGLVATNTTLARSIAHPLSGEAGGLSGAPLRTRATEVIARAHLRAPKLPIIGVGGIFTAADAYEKIRAGASLVQLYTGFVYGGPGTVARVLDGLEALLLRDRYPSLAAAVGTALL